MTPNTPWWAKEKRNEEEMERENELSSLSRENDQEDEEEQKQEIIDRVTTQLADRLSRGRRVLKGCESAIIENFRVEGKSLEEWKEELQVAIPDTDDNPDELGFALCEVARAVQLADSLLASHELRTSIVQSIHDAEYTKKYVEQLEKIEKKGRASAEKIKQLASADDEIDLLLSASQITSAITEYFKRIVRGLEETRKTLESRVMLLGIKMKHLHHS